MQRHVANRVATLMIRKTSRMPTAKPEKPRTFSVYVIALDPAVLDSRRFSDANPDYRPGKPCVYVGMTGKSPAERFEQHKSGYKSSRYPREYGRYIRWRLFEKFNPMTYVKAQEKEVELAKDLRARGYAVWQN